MTDDHEFVFVGGLHKSGTSLLARCLAEHPDISAFARTGVPEDEGQHLQTVFRPALAHGGPGRFGLDPASHLTEDSVLVSPSNRDRLFAEWSPHWDLTKRFLLEKSPPNLIRSRFLQALFPNSHFVMILRDPIAVSFATQKWSRTPIESLIWHWLVSHETFAGDRAHIDRVMVVTYENLVRRPQAVLNTIYEFLGLSPVTSTIEIRPELNASYRQHWIEGASERRFGPGAATSREVEERLAQFGYSLK